MKELNLTAKLWIGFGLGIALVLAICYSFYTQEWVLYDAQISQLEDNIVTKKKRLREILAKKQRLQELEVEIQEAKDEFERLKEMFPDEEVIPSRLFDLTTVTRRALAIPTRFLPLQSQEKDFYKENYYSITISSGFHSLGLLFSEMANFKYPTVVRKLKIDKNPQVEKVITDAREHGEIAKTIIASFELTTFTSKK